MTICQEMRDVVKTIRQKFPHAKCRLTCDKDVRDHQFDDYLEVNHADKSISVSHGSRTQRMFGMTWHVSWADHTARKLEDTMSSHEEPKQVVRKVGQILRTRCGIGIHI